MTCVCCAGNCCGLDSVAVGMGDAPPPPPMKHCSTGASWSSIPFVRLCPTTATCHSSPLGIFGRLGAWPVPLGEIVSGQVRVALQPLGNSPGVVGGIGLHSLWKLCPAWVNRPSTPWPCRGFLGNGLHPLGTLCPVRANKVFPPPPIGNALAREHRQIAICKVGLRPGQVGL